MINLRNYKLALILISHFIVDKENLAFILSDNTLRTKEKIVFVLKQKWFWCLIFLVIFLCLFIIMLMNFMEIRGSLNEIKLMLPVERVVVSDTREMENCMLKVNTLINSLKDIFTQ